MKKGCKLLLTLTAMLVVLCTVAACNPTVTAIELSKEPTKLYYSSEDYTDIDLAGGELLVTYSDGSTVTLALPAEGVTVDYSAVDSTLLDSYVIVVKYGGAEAEYVIELGYPRRTVTFDLNYTGAPTATTQTVTNGQTVRLPSEPTRTDYIFDGWYTEAACTTRFADTTEIRVDTTLYAKWKELITVSFSYNYTSSPAPITQKVEQGTAVSAPATSPAREGYAFAGWYEDAACTSVYNFNTLVTEAKTVYAKWLNIYSVTFNLNYENAPAPAVEQVADGQQAEGSTPTRTGYVFIGWYNETEGTTEYDLTTAVTANKTVYAKWEAEAAVQHDFTFNYNYTGAPTATVAKVNDNGRATRPANPTRAGYTFAGWYNEAEGTTVYDFATAVTADKTIYAKWNKQPEVTFNYNYENAPAAYVQQVAEGTKAIAPATPTRADVSTKGHQAQNFTFVGWYTDAACTAAFDFDTVITADTQLYAKWTGTYLFEAEHVNLVGKAGNGYSGAASGANMVDQADDQNNVGASNRYYLTYLYSTGLSVEFNIVSDREVEDAKIVIRVTAENQTITLSPDLYSIVLTSGTHEYELFYESFELPAVPITDDKIPFFDRTLELNVHLYEGVNTITCTAINSEPMGGTMSATAPIIDCFKITTSAELSWTPIVANEVGQ